MWIVREVGMLFRIRVLMCTLALGLSGRILSPGRSDLLFEIHDELQAGVRTPLFWFGVGAIPGADGGDSPAEPDPTTGASHDLQSCHHPEVRVVQDVAVV